MRRALTAVLLAAAGAAGCSGRTGCLGGDDGRCRPQTACPVRPPSCAGGSLRIGVVERDGWTTARAVGGKAAAAVGDFVLENDRVRLVVDAPAHAQGLAPSGGSILDLSPVGAGSGDQVNGLFQGAGLLPRDAVRYRRAEIVDGAPEFVALIVRGHLDGDAKVTVVTRYELRPCETGVRVRTELWNGSDDPNTFYLTDGLFWGDRTLLPFVPLRGQGFRHPKLDLLALAKAWRRWPFVAARAQAEPHVGYAVVPCGTKKGEGFNDPTLSATGVALGTTLPGDALVLERFVAVAAGAGLAPVVGEALRLRALLHGEPLPWRLRGRVVTGDPPVPLDGRGGRAASVLFYEPAPDGDPDDEAARTPWTEAVPGPDGFFDVDLPAGRPLRARPYAFGRPAGEAIDLAAGGGEVDIAVERPARLLVAVEDETGKPAEVAELVLVPAARDVAAGPSLYGQFAGCDPMLGPAHGGSPACNRALVVDGRADLLAPPGHYFVLATRGPFATLGRGEVTLSPGDEASLTLRSGRLPLLPPGTLAADFHVHGSASFDSSMPDQDRVLSFLAAGIDVVAATDHDVVVTYDEALDALAARDRLVVMPGVEATPNILWFRVPGEAFPKTLGHFNFWPLRHDRFLPRGGAPWDELAEPGALMDALDPLWTAPAAGVRQMNHPWSDAKLGRDQGFLRVLGHDPRRPVQPGASFSADVLLRRPQGGHRNLDFDTQEVMSGASRRDWLRQRALWFAFLDQGLFKAGTANSDTHSFAVEPAGYARTVVLGHHSVRAFDATAFNADVKAGRIVGTNGPVVLARIEEPEGRRLGPQLVPATPARGAVVVVDLAAAPWIPTSEVRFVVNGRVARTIPVFDGAFDPVAPAERRAELRVPLAELVGDRTGDAWLVVETGLPLPLVGDLDDDGIADTADLDDNGVVDERDRPDDDDDEVRFPNPAPALPGDERFLLDAIAPGTWPYAFTNPFVLDLDGGGWTPPAR